MSNVITLTLLTLCQSQAGHDTIKDVAGTNRFKSFIDKLYVVYHASPKNARELQSCANMMDMEILKIM
jgi:hypothetical protein